MNIRADFSERQLHIEFVKTVMYRRISYNVVIKGTEVPGGGCHLARSWKYHSIG